MKKLFTIMFAVLGIVLTSCDKELTPEQILASIEGKWVCTSQELVYINHTDVFQYEIGKDDNISVFLIKGNTLTYGSVKLETSDYITKFDSSCELNCNEGVISCLMTDGWGSSECTFRLEGDKLITVQGYDGSIMKNRRTTFVRTDLPVKEATE